MVRVGQTYYYHTDRLGSVLALTNSSGVVVEKYSYDTYGVPSVWSDELGRYRSMWDSAIGNTLLYTGRPYDRIVGLYDMRARQYSAELGRFTSRDPIGMADDVNLYAYVANSPLNYTDRNGEAKRAIAQQARNFGVFLGQEADSDSWLDNYSASVTQQVWGGTINYLSKLDSLSDKEITIGAGTEVLLLLPAGKFLKKTVKIWEDTLELSEHVLQRMQARGISLEKLQETVNIWEQFEYIKDWKKLRWFFSEQTWIFVGAGEKITTTFEATSKYINNLKKTLWD